MRSFDLTFVLRYWEALLNGLSMTFQITIVSLACGVALGFLLSLLRNSANPILRAIGAAYVEVIRGIPVLILLFWIFFCLPVLTGLQIGSYASSVIALSLFTAAITSETFRSSLKSIGTDQYDACAALGLPWHIRTASVVAPQAVLRAMPNLLSNSVSLFKESSLVSAVGAVELMYVGQNISNSTARPIEVLTAVGIIYFVIGFALTRLVAVAERRLMIRIQM